MCFRKYNRDRKLCVISQCGLMFILCCWCKVNLANIYTLLLLIRMWKSVRESVVQENVGQGSV